MQTNPTHPTHHSGHPLPSSKQHLNLPQLSEYNEDEYAGFFLQSFYKNVSHVRQISRPFNIPILKQEIETLLQSGDLSPNILAFLITYIRNSLEQLKIEKPAYMLGINVTNYSKADKKISFEYLQTLTNPYKGFKADLVKSGINLFISFFYNGRWVLCVLDPKKGKCNMIDFLDKSLTPKGANDELYEVIKAYLRDEFDIKPSSVSFFDKFKREKTENCGLFVAKFLANFFFANVALEKITITDDEKNHFKKIIAWLIIKIDPPREESSASLRSNDKSYKNMLPHDILQGHRASKPLSSMKTIRGMFEETKEENKVRLTKDELAAMLDKVKAEVIEEMGSDDEDISDFLEKEGLFNDSKYSTEVLSQSHLRELIKKAKKRKEKNRLKKEQEQNQPATYEEYMQQMYDYQKQVSEFHGMLSYFQRFNPQMYTRIASELNSQVEDRLLEKFNMLHVKYPDNNALSDQPRGSQIGSSLPSASSHGRLASLGRASLGVFNPNQYDPYGNKKTDPGHTIYTHQGSQPRGSNALISAMSRGSTVVSPYQSPHQLSFGSPEKPLSSVTSSRTHSSQSGGLGGVGSPLFNAGKALMGGENRASGQQNPQIIARRYGMTITREDYKRLKMDNLMSNEIMNFYLGYLREKQRFIDPNRMKLYELNVFYFGNEFYQMLTNNRPAATNINYENVKSFTSKYSGNNKTIFDTFHKIVFIMRMTNENYALVYVNNMDKKIYLFDPNKPRDHSPHENPVLLNILNYIDFEYQDKLKKKIDTKKWQLLYGNVMKANNPRDSGVIVAKIAHSVQKGAIEGNYGDEIIWKFKSDFIDLILKIGIAEDPKENMSWIAQHVI